MFGDYGVTDNAGLTRLMHDAENSPVRDGPRNRSVFSEKLIPLLWEPGSCCDAKGYKPEVLKPCPGCDAEQYVESPVCDECFACMHCGGDPSENDRNGARHLCKFRMMHNGHEWRTQWMVRVKAETPGAKHINDDPENPIWMLEIWLDVGFDLLDEVTWSSRKEEILRGSDMTPEEEEAMLDGTLDAKLKGGRP